ncbi:MAG: DUF4230 domain-containing protein [Spirochaetales bacterium]|nr:DUF4230 domain-containing protein [Spirochaetales bacterium]
MDKRRTLSIALLSLMAFVLIFTGTLIGTEERARLDTLEEKISLQSHLVTARQTYREVIYTKITAGPMAKELLFSADFAVEAGVDLSRCRLKRNWKGQLVLILPPVQIFSVDFVEDSIQEYVAWEFLARINQKDYLPLIAEEKSLLREEALQSELIPRAENNVRSFLRGPLSRSGWDYVDIRFRNTLPDALRKISPLPIRKGASRG